MSWFSNPKKALRRNFSLDSWKRGKGFIGHYNPAVKIFKDTRKVVRGVRSMLKPQQANSAVSASSDVYGPSGSIVGRT